MIEYQRRGLIHFHAVVRLDGPDGPDQPPPPWASTDLLDRALRAAAAEVAVPVPHPDGQSPPLTLGWGRQLDIQPIHVAADLDGIADKHVARYIAKYATKGADHAAAQARHRDGRPEPDPNRPTIKIGRWKYTGGGLRHGEHLWAAQTRERIQTARRIQRQTTDSDDQAEAD